MTAFLKYIMLEEKPRKVTLCDLSVRKAPKKNNDMIL